MRRETKRKRFIMVVDDEENVVELVKRILETDGYQVATASNGDMLRALLTRNKPDLILLDILMPNVDGYTLCSEIKSGRDTKDIPVVMLTGLGYELNKELAITSGADGYINKPINSANLLDTVARLLRRPS
jgi:DNA-binding response OmpR family regulator